ncbi:unnamed protein product [Owenia fusiformis]|uniref:guanylate cyclase n=1 Tax=Owenia fusiformis TaxID=6347 RepID=A0A8J1UHH7_OWEFU|nr:unnamed protein product [Owenia fusiformis]
MYGYFNLIIKRFIIEKFGEEKWNNIINTSKCAKSYDEFAVYDDEVTTKIIKAASNAVDIKRDALLEMVGEYYLDHIMNTGHEKMLRRLGGNLLAFLENLDSLHTYKLSDYPEMNAPSFRCQDDSKEDRITLHYYSFRRGLHPLCQGIIKSVAKMFYKQEIKLEVLSNTLENVGTSKGAREHIVFDIKVMSNKPRPEMPPPTYVAQTQKHGEKNISPQDIDTAAAHAKEQPIQISKGGVLAAKWRASGQIAAIYGGFTPTYPEKMAIDAKTFCNVFPYHVIFDESLHIRGSGISMQQLMPEIRDTGASISTFFKQIYPHHMDFTFENIKKYINTPFHMETKHAKMNDKWGNKPMVILRGQMVHLAQDGYVVYLASPYVRCLQDLEDRKMHISEIAIHDVTRDLLMWEDELRCINPTLRFMSRREQSQVSVPERRKSGGSARGNRGVRRDRGGQEGQGVGGEADVLVDGDGIDQAAYDELLIKYRKCQGDYERERENALRMKYALLPKSVADTMIKSERAPEPGEFKSCTILFCDVVMFSKISKQCKPKKIMDLLTDLHVRYDKICDIHNVIRVETIGDAYMCISGAPDDCKTHAERIANAALGINLTSQEVKSPITYDDDDDGFIKVRIGVHTGTALAGVVGSRIPRYTIMGNTANMASKMESHGLPNRIQISHDVNKLLKRKGFIIIDRGEIEVRGGGKVYTYFLEGNKRKTEEELLGRSRNIEGIKLEDKDRSPSPVPSNDSGGQRRRSVTPRNKVHPRTDDYYNDGESHRLSTSGQMRYSDSPAAPRVNVTSTRDNARSGRSPRPRARQDSDRNYDDNQDVIIVDRRRDDRRVRPNSDSTDRHYGNGRGNMRPVQEEHRTVVRVNENDDGWAHPSDKRRNSPPERHTRVIHEYEDSYPQRGGRYDDRDYDDYPSGRGRPQYHNHGYNDDYDDRSRDRDRDRYYDDRRK